MNFLRACIYSDCWKGRGSENPSPARSGFQPSGRSGQGRESGVTRARFFVDLYPWIYCVSSIEMYPIREPTRRQGTSPRDSVLSISPRSGHSALHIDYLPSLEALVRAIPPVLTVSRIFLNLSLDVLNRKRPRKMSRCPVLEYSVDSQGG